MHSHICDLCYLNGTVSAVIPGIQEVNGEEKWQWLIFSISESHSVLLVFLYNFIFNTVISTVNPEGMTAVVLLWGGGCLFFTLSEKVETQGTRCRSHSIAETLHLPVGMGSLTHLDMLKKTLRNGKIIKINYFSEALLKAYFIHHLCAGIFYSVSSCINLYTNS